MTRKKAKEFNWYGYGREEINNQIDKIFDDIESRRCENCANWKQGNCGLIRFSLAYDCYGKPVDIREIDTKSNFGCNMFERKQKETK